MVQIIDDPLSGNVFGRIGKGLGQGLSEQVPKEVAHYRLSKGLEQLGNESADLSPFQRFSRLLAIPGMTPQGIQSGSELLKQEGINKSLINKAQTEKQPGTNPFPQSKGIDGGKGRPSITSKEGIQATIENYLPPTFEEIQEGAGELMRKDPQLYGNDPDKAMAASALKAQQEQARNQALQQRRLGQQQVQDRVVSDLQKQRESFNVKVPENVYSKIEDKAIEAVNSGDMTEQQAKKNFGDELDAISRDYQALETVGTWRVLGQSAKDMKKELKSIGDKFRDRGEQENLADLYVSKNNLSPSKASYLAWPISDEKILNNALVKTPSIKSGPRFGPLAQIEEKTLNETKKIAPLLGDKGSPLAVAEELRSKGYDPDIWMDYLRKNRKELGLKEWQGRELDKPSNFFSTLEDILFFSMLGKNELLEQE